MFGPTLYGAQGDPATPFSFGEGLKQALVLFLQSLCSGSLSASHSALASECYSHPGASVEANNIVPFI